MKHRAIVTLRTTPDGERWFVAQLLDYDIAVQAKTEEQAKVDLVDCIRARRQIAAEYSIPGPFHGIGPAPESVQRRWEKHGFMLEENERSAG